jgi:hypothetical protein
MELVPDRRPCGREGAADELVEQLDREQRRDERRGARAGGSGSVANSHEANSRRFAAPRRAPLAADVRSAMFTARQSALAILPIDMTISGPA